MALWRWSGVSAPLPSAVARDPLSLVRSSLISGFYSLALTRALLGLCSGGAAAGQQVGRPRRGRAVRTPHPVGIPLRETLEQLPVAGLAQLLADGADRGLDHRVAVASAHQVRTHELEVLVRRLDQHYADALG